MLHCVPFFDDISRSTVATLIDLLKRPHAPRLVLLDSSGGFLDGFSTWAYPLVRRRVSMIADDIGSAANCLFAAAAKRYAFEDSTFFFHEFVVHQRGQAFSRQEIDLLRWIQKKMGNQNYLLAHNFLNMLANAQSDAAHFISNQTRMSRERVLSLMKSNVTISAQEARRYGFVHEILPDSVRDEIVLVEP